MKTIKAALALAMLFTLSGFIGCTPQGVIPLGVVLPHAPAHYVSCFKQLTTIPIESLTREKVVRLVADLRKSELAKSRCGRDLLDWYSKVRVAYGPKK